MFDNLTERLSRVVKTMRGQARLTDDNIQEALREVRLALLEADVALPVVKDFVARVREKAHRRGGRRLAHAGPGVHRRRAPRADGVDGRRGRAAEPRDAAAGGFPARRAAGRRQDDDRREARAAVARGPEEEGAAGLGRRLSPGGDRATSHARKPGERRLLPVDAGPEAGGHRASRPSTGRGATITTSSSSTPPAGSRSTKR